MVKIPTKDWEETKYMIKAGIIPVRGVSFANLVALKAKQISRIGILE